MHVNTTCTYVSLKLIHNSFFTDQCTVSVISSDSVFFELFKYFIFCYNWNQYRLVIRIYFFPRRYFIFSSVCAKAPVLSFDLQYIKVILWVWKTIKWPFAGQQVPFKSTMNLNTDRVRNLVKGTKTHSLKLVLNGVSPQIRPLTPDLRCRGPITPTAFSCFQPFGARRWVLRFSGELKYSLAVSFVFLPVSLRVRHAPRPSVRLSLRMPVCQGASSCWIESGSSPWQSSTGSYGSSATAGWIHAVTGRQEMIKFVLVLHQTHAHLYCAQS